jgi:hypothetical protein
VSNKTHCIVLFEDDEEFGAKVEKAIRAKLPEHFALERFPLDKSPTKGDKGPYEDMLAKALGRPPFRDVVLLVADRDLSASEWGGLSEAAIARVGQHLGVPMAWYARRGQVPSHLVIVRVPGDGRIELPNTPGEIAHQVAVIARGFVDLERQLGSPSSSGRARPKTPGELLATVLDEPAAGSHLDAYACGDQHVVAEFVGAGRHGGAARRSGEHRRLVVALGVWIVDVVLKYPGVLLDDVAAASYLDIHQTDFASPGIRKLFRAAEWRNAPFVDPGTPRWWKTRLDALLAKNGVQLGAEMVQKRTGRRPKYCPCHVDGSLHAGYYCMVEQKPVSLQNSIGPIRWFPPGAVLARITRSVFDRVGPWLGA